MKYLKPIKESIETDKAYEEWKQLRSRITQVFSFLGSKVLHNIKGTNEKRYYYNIEFDMARTSVAYSILGLIHCNKEIENSVNVIQKSANLTNEISDGINIAVSDNNKGIEGNDDDGVYIINPKNSTDAYNQIINYMTKIYQKYCDANGDDISYQIATQYLTLNKNYNNKEIITNDYIISHTMDAVSRFKNSYNVVQKLKENRPDLYNKLEQFSPEINKSNDLSQMGFSD